MDPQAIRVIRDLVDRINFLTMEVGRLAERDLTVMPNGVARKENPIEGVINIPSRGFNTAQDGLVRVSRDGVIVSYINPTEPTFPYVDNSTVNNSGAGPDTLHTFSLPANSLRNDKDYIDLWYAGGSVNNANTKFVNARFGGNIYEGIGALAM